METGGKHEIALIDPQLAVRYRLPMIAVEFVTELSGATVLTILSEIAVQLPKVGKARIVVLAEEPTDDEEVARSGLRAILARRLFGGRYLRLDALNDCHMSTATPEQSAATAPSDFIRDIVAGHVAEGRYPRIHTRFPPEPNGYLHIGHAKSICLNFGIAREFGGVCNLRMDDTNPAKEEVEYVDSIIADVKWLVGGWADDRLGLKPANATPKAIDSNGQPDFFLGPVTGRGRRRREVGTRSTPLIIFEQIYNYAVALIEKGKAYVCDLSPEDTDAYRGAPDRPGKDSPFRTRTTAESLDLFKRMKAGEFPDSARTLRARIDMASPQYLDAGSDSLSHSPMPSIITRATNGASIRCMISPIA